MTGSIGILNVGAGDTKLTFDKSNPAETIRAARIVKDMLRRGYALLVAVPGTKEGDTPTYTRVIDFDENTCEYIIADFDPTHAPAPEAVPHDQAQQQPAAAPSNESGAAPNRGKGKRGRPARRVAAAGTTGVAVARSAGG